MRMQTCLPVTIAVCCLKPCTPESERFKTDVLPNDRATNPPHRREEEKIRSNIVMLSTKSIDLYALKCAQHFTVLTDFQTIFCFKFTLQFAIHWYPNKEHI
jgi:hypothetical protein